MGLELPARVAEMKDSGDAVSEFALDVTFHDGTTIHIATWETDAELNGATVHYIPSLRARPRLKQSLRKTTDAADLSIQNVDKVIGTTVFSAQRLNRATATLWSLFIDEQDDFTPYLVWRMSGRITGAAGTGHTRVGFRLVSHVATAQMRRALRTLSPGCQFGYKTDPRCGSTDPSLTCSYQREGANGCKTKLPAARIVDPLPAAGEGNSASFGGFTETPIQPPASSTRPIFDGRDPFDPEDPPWIGGGRGRHRMPRYTPIMPVVQL